MAEELKQFKEEIVKIVKEESTETRRHFDVVAEGLKHEIQLVAEGVSLNTQQIEGIRKDITEIKQDIEIVKVDTAVIKMDIEFIKNDLKQKINREEFAFLEKRVSMLEARLNQNK